MQKCMDRQGKVLAGLMKEVQGDDDGGLVMGTDPDKEALRVASVLGSLPPSPTPVAQLPAEHGPQPPLRRVCTPHARMVDITSWLSSHVTSKYL